MVSPEILSSSERFASDIASLISAPHFSPGACSVADPSTVDERTFYIEVDKNVFPGTGIIDEVTNYVFEHDLNINNYAFSNVSIEKAFLSKINFKSCLFSLSLDEKTYGRDILAKQEIYNEHPFVQQDKKYIDEQLYARLKLSMLTQALLQHLADKTYLDDDISNKDAAVLECVARSEIALNLFLNHPEVQTHFNEKPAFLNDCYSEIAFYISEQLEEDKRSIVFDSLRERVKLIHSNLLSLNITAAPLLLQNLDPNQPHLLVISELTNALQEAPPRWDLIENLCAIEGDNRLNKKRIKAVFSKAISSDQIELVKKLVVLKTDNRPSKNTVINELIKLLNTKPLKWELIEALCAIEGDNKPDKLTIDLVFNVAATYKNTKLLEQLSHLESDNAPDANTVSKTIFNILNILEIPWESLEILCGLQANKKPMPLALAFALTVAKQTPIEGETIIKLLEEPNANTQHVPIVSLPDAEKVPPQADKKPNPEALSFALPVAKQTPIEGETIIELLEEPKKNVQHAPIMSSPDAENLAPHEVVTPPQVRNTESEKAELKFNEQWKSAISDAMQEAISNMGFRFAGGKAEKKKELQKLMAEFEAMMKEPQKTDEMIQTVLKNFWKVLATPRKGLLNFFPATFGNTHSAQAFKKYINQQSVDLKTYMKEIISSQEDTESAKIDEKLNHG